MFLISPLHHLHFVKYLMSLKVYHYGNKIPAPPHPPQYIWMVQNWIPRVPKPKWFKLLVLEENMAFKAYHFKIHIMCGVYM